MTDASRPPGERGVGTGRSDRTSPPPSVSETHKLPVPLTSDPSAMDMTVTVGSTTATISLAGEVDATNAYLVQVAAQSAFESGAINVVFDVSGVEFLDSSCLGVFAYAAEQTELRGGTVKVANPSPLVRRIFEVTGLETVLGLA